MVAMARILIGSLVVAGAVQAQEARVLRYGFQPGEVLHYGIEMSNAFTAGETRNHETIRGIETLVVTERDEQSITILPLASGLRLAELSVHGQDLEAYGRAHREWPDPFFGTGLQFETPPSVPPLIPLGKVVVRFSATGDAPPEAMMPRFFSLLALLGEYLQNYMTTVAHPWVLLPNRAVAVDDTWFHTLPGASDSFHYVYHGPEEEAGIPCDRIRGTLAIPPDISSSWGASEGTAIETTLCLARDGGFPVSEAFHSRSLGEDSELVQSVRATLLGRERLDEAALGIVRETADTTFPALGEPGPEEFEDLIDRPHPALEMRDSEDSSRRLSDFAGRVVVVHFWTPWSSQSAQSLTAFAAVRADFAPSDVALVAIIVEDEASRLLGLSSLILEQMDDAVIGYQVAPAELAAFHANAIVPVTVIVDREGIVRKAYAGYVGRGELQTAVGAIVDEGATP